LDSLFCTMRHSHFLRVSFRSLALFAIAPVTIATALVFDGLIGLIPIGSQAVNAQTGQPADPSRPLTLRSDIQEANSKTGVITARGNVQIYYPSRQIQATAAQAQYYSRERRIILTGDVYVLQQGNSLRGETITYLIDEGRFVALPQAPRQVEAIYLVQDSPAQSPTPVATPTPVPTADPFGQSEFTPSTTPNGATPPQPAPSR
jgi:lipopolysaccharide export system protein LptA